MVPGEEVARPAGAEEVLLRPAGVDEALFQKVFDLRELRLQEEEVCPHQADCPTAGNGGGQPPPPPVRMHGKTGFQLVGRGGSIEPPKTWGAVGSGKGFN